MTRSRTEELIALYAQLHEHTFRVCSGEHPQGCAKPFSCCVASACERVMENALWEWEVRLPRTNHPTLPLMGPDGCTVPPYLRSLCTVHACPVGILGALPEDWLDEYWGIRRRIEELEGPG